MPNQVIAVDDDLGNVRQALEAQGFEVVSLHDANNAGCYVVSGMDDNIAGIQDRMTGAPVIAAAGLSAQDVIDQIQQRIGDSAKSPGQRRPH